MQLCNVVVSKRRNAPAVATASCQFNANFEAFITFQ